MSSIEDKCANDCRIMALSVQVLASSRLHIVEDSVQSYNISAKSHKLTVDKIEESEK